MSITSAITSTVVHAARRAALLGGLLLLGTACAPLDSPASATRASTPANTASAASGSSTSTSSAANNCSSADSNAAKDNANEYKIGVGDNLAVNVWRNKDLSVTVPVRPDGKISVPLAGDIEVGARTPEQVGAAITEKLSKYIRDPFVTVIVTDMGSAAFRDRVRVTGAVQKPVSIPFRQGMTVLDVVLEAGGVNEFASLSRATLFRRDCSRLPVRLDHILRRGKMDTNYPILAGDVVTVPQSAF